MQRAAFFIVLALVLLLNPRSACCFEEKPIWGPDENDLFLPDGRDLPKMPVSVEGTWDDGTIFGVKWQADLEIKGDEFAGKITFPGMTEVMVPLTVQGSQNGNIVEFSVRYNEAEVAFFAGHLAGTSLVGTFDGITGQRGSWKGSWIPQTLVVKDEENEKEIK